MGLALLKALTSKKDEIYELVVVNRGNTYWGGKSDQVIEASSLKVHKVVANRKKEDYAKKISDAVSALDGRVINIIDFCCFKPRECD